MTKHKTGTREEWLAARLELLEAEKELTRRSDALARRQHAAGGSLAAACMASTSAFRLRFCVGITYASSNDQAVALGSRCSPAFLVGKLL